MFSRFRHSLFLVLSALLIVCQVQLTARAESGTATPRSKNITVVPEHASSAGRVYEVDLSGKIIREFSGFILPVFITTDNVAGVFRVLDQGANRLYTVSLKGELLNTVNLPSQFPLPLRFEHLNDGRYLVVAGPYGVYEVSPSGDVVWSKTPPLPGSRISGATRISGGRTVVSVEAPDKGQPILFIYQSDDSPPQPLAFTPTESTRNASGLLRDGGFGEDRLLLWDNSWENSYIMSISADNKVTITRSLRGIRPQEVRISADRIMTTHDDFAVAIRDQDGGAFSRLEGLFRALSASFLKGRESVLVAVQTEPNLVFDRTINTKTEPTPMKWGIFWSWVIGASLVAAGAILSRKYSPEGGRTRTLWGSIFGLALLGGFAQVYVGDNSSYYAHRVGVWVASLVMLASLSLNPQRLLPSSKQLVEILCDLALPLIVATFTLCYHLLDLPRYYHFDFTYYLISGYPIIEGKAPSIWENGFVPAPIIGLFPHLLAIKLFGLTPLSFRVGAVAIGFVGVVVTYALGRLWAGRLVGVLGALFLAGNAQYIHFNRMPATGESTVAALLVLWTFAIAMRSSSMRPWISCGLLAGYSWFLWPVSRTGAISILLTFLILSIRSPRRTIREWYKPVALALSFFIFVSPLIPLWVKNPKLMIPRVETSMEVYDFASSRFAWTDIAESFGVPFKASALWFFSSLDQSSQGSLSPALNQGEQIIFLIGIISLVAVRNRTTLLLFIHLLATLVVCGAWALSPPWSTRLLPTIPVVALFMALAVKQFIRLVPLIPSRVLNTGALLAVLVISPAWNFKRYSDYELGRAGSKFGEMSAIGHALREVPVTVPGFLVSTRKLDWNLKEGARFGELLPFIVGRRIEEVRDLDSLLPLPEGTQAVFMLQATRSEEDFKTISKAHPDARLQELRDPAGNHLASLAHVGEPSPNNKPGN